MLFGKKKNSDGNNDDRIQVDTRTITTMVGEDTVIKGELKTEASVRINGTVLGDVRARGVVVLTKTGKIEGTIEAESIIVAGVVKGNMSIRDKVNVEATGKIYGDVITKKFVIDEESIFQGNCIMNRDGKVIPVPPYISEEEKQRIEKEKAEKEKAEKEKAEKEKLEKEKAEKEKTEKEKAEKKDKEDGTDDSEESDSDDENKDDDSASDSDDEGEEESDESGEEDGSDNEEGKESEKDDLESESEDSIIIADINKVQNADDIPASDGVNALRKKGKKHQRENYIKRSKSLSVEIEK